VAFIAAPTADPMGNCSGKYGPSACGSLGYAFADAMFAKKVVVITDNLVSYPMQDFSISENYVDYVVEVDAIGNPKGIVSGTTRITRDPVGLVMAANAAKVIEASGLLKDGFSFQTGAGGASLAAAKFLKDIMLQKGVQGSFGMGGITGYMVDMLQAGCFRTLMDVQETTIAISDELDQIEEDLDAIEDYIMDEEYDDEDYDDEDDFDDYEDDEDDEEGFDFGDPDTTIYEVECACGQIIDFDEETLEEGSIVCPACGETLEFSTDDENEE
jgi:citrate lyase alpha subunit